MARTKQTARPTRGGGGFRNNPRPFKEREDPTILAAKKEAERRERILGERRRYAAKWRPKIAAVRKVNFENFKNRFQDIDAPDYAVDVLVAGPGLQAQIRREQAARHREDIARMRAEFFKFRDDSYSSRVKKNTDPYEKTRREKSMKTEMLNAQDADIQRIRIQSQPILGHLTSLINDTELRSTPRTFMKPFKTLIYFQPKMKEILATLEEKWGDFEELDEDKPESIEEVDADDVVDVKPLTKENLEATGSGETSGNSEEEEDDDADSLITVNSRDDEDFDTAMDSPEALRDMRAYVKFMDDEVMPLYKKYDGSTADKVKFDDLWSLFRPGDLVYFPASGETGSRYHEIWRIYKVTLPEPEIKPAANAWAFFADELQEKESSTPFKLSAYYIDHDGSNFGAVRRKFEIDSFVGARQIDSLEVFPIRFYQDHPRLIQDLKQQGRNFLRYLDDRHQQYSAWTLTRNPPQHRTDPDEEILKTENYEPMRHPEFVESDVIVDLMEAFHKNPDWRPRFYQPRPHKSTRCETEYDEMQIQHWFNGSRQERAYEQNELIQKQDGIEGRQRRENFKADTFLNYRIRGTRTFELNPKALELRDEDLVLLPKRMFAYALRERRFLPIDLNSLKAVPRQPGVFENLRIQSDYKDVVRGLVMSHFQKKELERKYADASTEGPGQDLIQGKGRGLVVLLHGVPGVGKTATAEAVAMENRKPLFVITCGDLGLTPDAVEHSLKNVFRLAHLWDCVLLLDEADVFLSQRSKDDMKRNALVSVFLRVLEYYNGLLFLTTNRVGTIDEAFKSRIHLSLYYPPLDRTQTRDIFRLNIAKLKLIESERHRMTGEPALAIKEAEVLDFAARHYEELARSTGCWNGRQIRSAFQIASSLAHHNYMKDVEAARGRGQMPPAAPVLDSMLFEKVQMSTQSFDKHMKKEAGKFDSELPLRGTFHEQGKYD